MGCRRGLMAVAFLAAGLPAYWMVQTALACAPVPAPVRDINAVDYHHIGADGMNIDPALKARNDAAMEPMRTFVRLVSASADRFLADSKVPAANCTLGNLRQWAEGGAMLGVIANMQAERERAGLLSGLAFAYLKTKDSASPSDRAAIEPWLDKLAAGVEAGFGDQAKPANRILALAGLATMVVAASTDNHEHWRFAETAYDRSLAAIDDDGVLAVEMGGGERALFDQDFALGALVMTAELAAKKSGEDWYMRSGEAIHRLADRVLDGLHDPAWFADQTGKSQFLPTGRDLAWIAFYARRFPDRFAGRVPDGAVFQSPRLGGDLTVLAEKWVRN
ncbi:poly(beta-D-mannuronate) lyase [Rhizobiales bacterium GAS188]|nr:poly(beta-D-mannuronate) lyase [Rhizobiales bacterium GAS188]